ncbi:uncharacterized protein LOC131326266 [Rhododendron vialii]|uniref:uncharacterized protein LOC131326266 n=1 Tax=Rhododendron vialii TaxID=182163 RepID=UPI00265EDA2A|nr:uncharacterized protein LOC131326266 [Rhododendron vialii]
MNRRRGTTTNPNKTDPSLPPFLILFQIEERGDTIDANQQTLRIATRRPGWIGASTWIEMSTITLGDVFEVESRSCLGEVRHQSSTLQNLIVRGRVRDLVHGDLGVGG